uniref:Uncharacterized protein n=1 Tax=Anguilla anguilla TaxID=7936 RepID=A0A0E9PT71_ANGAN
MKINSSAADYESNITDRDCQTFLTVGQSFTSVTACGYFTYTRALLYPIC